MNTQFHERMAEATRLTRAGNLVAATAVLQAALGGTDPKATLPNATPMPQPPFSEGFVSGRHSEAAGTRGFKLYTPPGASAAARPLVVMLHGCTQDPDDFAAGTAMNDLARDQGFYVLYPAQSRDLNPQGCWNWFKHNHQGRARGEPAVIAGMVRSILDRHPIDPRQVFAAGLSAGGAMAAILGDTHPELFAAIGVHSGLAPGAAKDLRSALAAMQGARLPAARAPSGKPTIVFHGDADTTVHPSNAHAVVAAAAGAGNSISVAQRAERGSRPSTVSLHFAPDGRVLAEQWTVHGAGHAWSGGQAKGSYADPNGPDASAEMLRFFLEHPLA